MSSFSANLVRSVRRTRSSAPSALPRSRRRLRVAPPRPMAARIRGRRQLPALCSDESMRTVPTHLVKVKSISIVRRTISENSAGVKQFVDRPAAGECAAASAWLGGLSAVTL
jgi:hypothetical protein